MNAKILAITAQMMNLMIYGTRPRIIMDWTTGRAVEFQTIWIDEKAEVTYEALSAMLSLELATERMLRAAESIRNYYGERNNPK